MNLIKKNAHLCLLFICFCASNAHATPLKTVLNRFSQQNLNDKAALNWDAYRKIKGLKLNTNSLPINHDQYFSNFGSLKTRFLGNFEITFSGKDERVQSIFMTSPIPSRNFKRILELEVGRSAVKELKNCRSTFVVNQKSYVISLNGKSLIYVDADANFSFKPTMSPLSTSFSFYLERPNAWAC